MSLKSYCCTQHQINHLNTHVLNVFYIESLKKVTKKDDHPKCRPLFGGLYCFHFFNEVTVKSVP